MKKIFLIPLSFALAACSFNSDEVKQSFDEMKASAHTLVEPGHNNYWKNNFTSYRMYPVNFYTTYNQPHNTQNTQQTVNMREYARNTAVSAKVGQRMIDSETFTVTQNDNSDKYTASADGKLYKANAELLIRGNDILEPIGEVQIDGSYFLIFDPQRDGRVFLIDATGQIIPTMGHIDGKNLILSREIVVLTPKDLRMNQANPSVVNGTPQKHFEIKYDGIKAGAMTFIYTNYENNTMQRFSFPKGRKIVDINGVKLNILDSDENQIVYMIID